jgi:RNA polymerase sigma-32 factor
MATYATDTSSAHYRSQVASRHALGLEEEADLAERWRNGEAAAGSALIECNLRHVATIAREYRRWGVAFDDLVQQGSIGLLKAAQRFDPTCGNSLRVYASYWIRAEIREYVVRFYRIVRLGSTRSERRALRAFRTSSVETVEQLAERSGMPEPRCRLLWPLLTHGDRSLDSSPSGGTSPRELLRGAGLDPEHIAIQHETEQHASDRVQRALAVLSDRERQIVWARMATDEPETLEHIGKKLGVSRERVRQLEQRARTKLREILTAETPAAVATQ